MALTICLLPVLLAANTVLAGIWGVVLPVTGTATAFLMLQIELAGESARTDPDARRAARLVIEGRLAVVLGMFLLFTVTLRAGFTPDFVCRDFLWVLAVLAFRDFFRLRRWAALVEVVFLIATVAVVQMLRGNATIAAAGFGAGLSTFARGMIESLQGLAAESKQSRTPGFV